MQTEIYVNANRNKLMSAYFLVSPYFIANNFLYTMCYEQ